MDADRRYSRGEVYIAAFDPSLWPDLGGTRSVLILQNNEGAFFGETLIVAPIEQHSWKREQQDTDYILEDLPFLDGPCAVQLDQVRNLDKRRIRRYLGRVSRKQMREVDEALQDGLGVRIPETAEFP